jgi:hypothetical protein
MGIKKRIKIIIKSLHHFINNPNLYIAAVVGAIIGGVTGGAVGLISGGFIGYSFKICHACVPPLYDINPDITVGGILGLVIGTALGGAITAIVAVYKIHKNTRYLLNMSSEYITQVLLGALGISIEIAIGMGLGAIIGSLKLPGIGSALGAFVGIGLMLFTTTFDNKTRDY